jgi:hypothetical protein
MLTATYTDLRTRKIKNHTTVTMMITGLAIALFFNGINGFLLSLTGLLATGFIMALFPGFRCGGGDIKLAAGCGAWLGIYPNYNNISLNYFLLFQNMLWFIIITASLSWIITTTLLIKKHGLADFGRIIYCEIITLISLLLGPFIKIFKKETYKNKYESYPTAPCMLIACIYVLYPVFGQLFF